MKKQIAFNRLFNHCFILGLFLIWCTIDLISTNDIAWAIGFGIAAFLFIVVPSIFTPFCYLFDSEGVSLCYIFLPTERYLWKHIRDITVEHLHEYGSRRSLHELLYSYVFSIDGKVVGKERFYMNGNIRKTHRTKRLLEKYWDGTITGYMFEDVKKWFKKRKAKKQRQIETHFTDEIVPMEREIRAKAREWLSPYISQAKLYDLDVRAEYVYVTSDFKESKTRPDEKYTYTMAIEISRPNEADEKKIVTLNIDLLHVRIGKTSYRGMENEYATEELQDNLTEALNEIAKNGFEAYCNN